MARDISLLDQIQIATPCTASWSAMKGDDRMRLCDHCSLHVYNIAAMTRAEAEKLIVETEGRVCARLYRRRDGTVITKDCPLGLATARRKLAAGLTWLGTLVAACVGLFFALVGRPQVTFALRNKEPFERVCRWLAPPAPQSPLMGVMLPPQRRMMGRIAPAKLNPEQVKQLILKTTQQNRTNSMETQP